MPKVTVIVSAWIFFSLGYVSCSKCGDTEWRTAAEDALQGFREPVQAKWAELAKARAQSDPWDTFLNKTQDLFPPNGKLQCFIGLQYNNITKALTVERTLFSTGQCNTPAFRVRMDSYLMIFRWLIATHDELALTHSFRFWVDIVDGCAGSDSMFERISYPLLGSGRSPNKHYALPIPEFYILLAVVATKPALLELFRQLPDGPVHAGFLNSMKGIFSYNYTTADWSHKQEQAVYRGSCIPTINSEPDIGPNYVVPRAELCSAVHNSPNSSLYDVGVFTPTYMGCGTAKALGLYSELCKSCSNCSMVGRIPRDEMRMYKYQIQVDGYGPTYDAVYWKLASGGVTFFIWPTEEKPYYTQWFYPLLKPSVHYIPVTTSTLNQHLIWCKKHDDLCRSIGESAASVMRCKVTVGTALHYMVKALQLVHDSQASSSKFA